MSPCGEPYKTNLAYFASSVRGVDSEAASTGHQQYKSSYLNRVIEEAISIGSRLTFRRSREYWLNTACIRHIQHSSLHDTVTLSSLTVVGICGKGRRIHLSTVITISIGLPTMQFEDWHGDHSRDLLSPS